MFQPRVPTKSTAHDGIGKRYPRTTNVEAYAGPIRPLALCDKCKEGLPNQEAPKVRARAWRGVPYGSTENYFDEEIANGQYRVGGPKLCQLPARSVRVMGDPIEVNEEDFLDPDGSRASIRFKVVKEWKGASSARTDFQQKIRGILFKHEVDYWKIELVNRKCTLSDSSQIGHVSPPTILVLATRQPGVMDDSWYWACKEIRQLCRDRGLLSGEEEKEEEEEKESKEENKVMTDTDAAAGAADSNNETKPKPGSSANLQAHPPPGVRPWKETGSLHDISVEIIDPSINRPEQTHSLSREDELQLGFRRYNSEGYPQMYFPEEIDECLDGKPYFWATILRIGTARREGVNTPTFWIYAKEGTDTDWMDCLEKLTQVMDKLGMGEVAVKITVAEWSGSERFIDDPWSIWNMWGPSPSNCVYS
ncbi:hypothetical protein L228DRAFT_165277 [Xylona heveae TC161]|uniref:Uncharacterized protein n=1 Tax=Xylona heveae (strain CBS 132557 / TC161) TaxID=1328760 RepID=A0A165FJB5_XYLHT|nr:hypothetical protein L228DRAFT_165277 [Xylona heveae TC161]KZF21042.1 hypothetical protein L228DRAFT_165277 [Xylona heveae TC161]